MLFGLSTLLLGALAVSLSRSYLLVLAGFLLIGIAKPVYDPSVQAFVSARTPYPKRARALGILESPWAGSWLLGIPISGFLIASFGWHSPFVMISGAALLAIIFTRGLEHDPPTTTEDGNNSNQNVSLSKNSPSQRGKPIFVLTVSLLMVFANENMVIVYGAWIEQQFHLNVQALGLFSMLVGLAELGGEFTVAALVDRIGKRRAILAGLILTGGSYLALPLCQGSIVLALAGLVAMFYLFEFTIVSIFPYVSELVPAERGKWLAFNYGCLVMGRLGGALSGPWLWQQNPDLSMLAVLSALAQVLAVLLLILASRRSTSDSRPPP
jgi:predicted MFS family arabinose efflux permease